MNIETIKTKELSDKFVMNTYNRLPLSFEKGDGVYLYDESGKKYLDFVAGIAVNSLGYGNKNFTDNMCEQIKKINHSSNLYHIKPQAKLAQVLVENSCFDKAFFCNSGAESVEAALKLARKYGNNIEPNVKTKIIAMRNSFHGRTMGALSVTGQEKYQKAFMPLIGGVEYAEFNNLESVEKIIDNTTSAVILECIQGEGGVIPATEAFIKGVRELCNNFNALLIIDEVQTGIGRTGKLFAYEHFDIEPDIICLAKGLGNGIPIGAMLAKEGVAKNFEPGDHASTFGGNFIAATAAKTVLSEIAKKNILKNVQETGSYLKEELKKLEYIKDVRGLGLMIGAEIDFKPIDIINKCQEKGLLIIGAGANTIRFVPPLTVDKSHIDSAVTIFKEALKEAVETKTDESLEKINNA